MMTALNASASPCLASWWRSCWRNARSPVVLRLNSIAVSHSSKLESANSTSASGEKGACEIRCQAITQTRQRTSSRTWGQIRCKRDTAESCRPSTCSSRTTDESGSSCASTRCTGTEPSRTSSTSWHPFAPSISWGSLTGREFSTGSYWHGRVAERASHPLAFTRGESQYTSGIRNDADTPESTITPSSRPFSCCFWSGPWMT